MRGPATLVRLGSKSHLCVHGNKGMNIMNTSSKCSSRASSSSFCLIIRCVIALKLSNSALTCGPAHAQEELRGHTSEVASSSRNEARRRRDEGGSGASYDTALDSHLEDGRVWPGRAHMPC